MYYAQKADDGDWHILVNYQDGKTLCGIPRDEIKRVEHGAEEVFEAHPKCTKCLVRAEWKALPPEARDGMADVMIG